MVGGSGVGLLDVADDRANFESTFIAEAETGLMVLQAGHPATSDWPLNPDNVVRALDRARGSYGVLIDGPTDTRDPLAPALAASGTHPSAGLGMTGQKQPQGPSRKSGAQDDNEKNALSLG